jgi:hypothetical protein
VYFGVSPLSILLVQHRKEVMLGVDCRVEQWRGKAFRCTQIGMHKHVCPVCQRNPPGLGTGCCMLAQ